MEAITGNFDEADAIRLENNIVNEIITYLSTVFILPLPYATEPTLITNAAKLTAAEIGFSRMAASIGNEPSEWTNRLKNEGWSSLQKIFINQNLPTGTPKSVPFWQRLIMSKTREKAVVADV
ncbi:MAG: hypothetical protein ACYS1A_08165 [Planctomycetota bacterium]